MPRLIHADQRWRQHTSHWAGINPPISMPTRYAINRAVIHAGGAADAAQHFLKFRAEHIGPAIINQHHMIFFRPIQITRPPTTRGKGSVD